MAVFFWLLIFSFVCYFFCAESVTKPTFYTAAVLEHSLYGPKTNSTPKMIVQENLAIYEKAASLAKSKGADIIVFPEYGLFSPNDRLVLKDYLENIPDPNKSFTNPCKEKETYSQRPILKSLSCMARSNYMFIVANMGDIQNCESHDDQCPSDGVYHHNANVVFDREGVLVLKFHKEHLFFELGMDLAKTQHPDPTFQTDFGRFATFISFDIIFKRMVDVSQWSNVDGIMFPSMWAEIAPQLTSVPFWQGWAVGNNVTLIAANVHVPGYYAMGSGIFHGRDGALVYTFNPDGLSKLTVARIPKRGFGYVPPEDSVSLITKDESWSHKQDGRHVGLECSRSILNETERIYNEHRCAEEDMSNYTFVKLSESSGHVEACNKGMCCSLDYTSNEMSEKFYLGVRNGTYDSFGRYHWCEENCVLVRCEALENKPCATFPARSKTVFHQIQLRANFTTHYVYPTVVSSGMRLLPRSEWKYSQAGHESTISFKHQIGKSFIVVGFKGRCYHRDPPYVR